MEHPVRDDEVLFPPVTGSELKHRESWGISDTAEKWTPFPKSESIQPSVPKLC